MALAACGSDNSSNSTEDDSASGTVAGLVGGALSNSTSDGALAMLSAPKNHGWVGAKDDSAWNLILPSAHAEDISTCPTARAPGNHCSASGSTLWLTYENCHAASWGAKWNGTQALTMSAGTAECGTFPKPAANQTLTRQFVAEAGSTTPASVVRTSRFRTQVTLDDASANLDNFDGATIETIANGGYGTQVSFDDNDHRNSLTIARHIVAANRFDISVSGSVAVTENSDSEREVNGEIKVYHNLLKVIGTSTLNAVTHNATCCLPVSGSITTSFAAGENVEPSVRGSLLVGKSETLTFTGCGTATLQTTSGTQVDVELSNCF